jgi:hypothetical protein
MAQDCDGRKGLNDLAPFYYFWEKGGITVAEELSSVEVIANALYQQKLERDRAKRREYARKWREKNREKVKANNERYIIKKAESLKAEAEQENNT